MNGIAITGYGSLSALGNSKNTFLDAFLNDEYGILNNVEYSEIFCKDPFLLACSKEPDSEKYNIKMPAWRLDSESKKAIYVASDALQNAGFDIEFFERHDNIGIIFATTYTGINSMWQNLRRISEKGVQSITPFKCVCGANAVLAAVCSRFCLKGYNNIFINPMLSSYSAIKCAYDRIITGQNKAMLILAGDPLSDVLIRLALKTGIMTGNSSRMFSGPFDLARNGIVLGEAYGAVILEDISHAKKRGAHIYANITGIGSCRRNIDENKGNALKISMQQAIKNSGKRKVDFVYAAANSTIFADMYESQAILQLINENTDGDMYVTALKSALGETFASAGVMQVIAAIESINNHFLPSIHGLKDKDSEYKDLRLLQAPLRGVSLQSGLLNGVNTRGDCYSLYIEK